MKTNTTYVNYLKTGKYYFVFFFLLWRAHEAYGYCQAGTSASLFDDDTMLIGSPGPYTWRGVIFVTSFLEDYLKRDKTMYYSKHEEESRFDEKLKKYSYLGNTIIT